MTLGELLGPQRQKPSFVMLNSLGNGYYELARVYNGATKWLEVVTREVITLPYDDGITKIALV